MVPSQDADTNVSKLDVPDDETIVNSNCSSEKSVNQQSVPPVYTRALFDGTEVPVPGSRFSKGLQVLQQPKPLSKRHVSNWNLPYYCRHTSPHFHQGTPFNTLAAQHLAARDYIHAASWHAFTPHSLVSPLVSMSHIYDYTEKNFLLTSY